MTPVVRPSYTDARLSPYGEKTGSDEREDPLHFATSLIERIGRTARQEIATHTYAHYYCGEDGQNLETFRADLSAAAAIATRRGLVLRSIVFPRNQHNPDYDEILLETGITAYRGNPPSYAWRFSDGAGGRRTGKRLVRLADSYIGLESSSTTPWDLVLQPNGLANVRASYPMRPYSSAFRALEPLRLRRIRSSLRHAARNWEIFHLWWHPHNFGRHTEENLAFLRKVLEEFDCLRRTEGMVSLAMMDVANVVRSEAGVAGQDVLNAGR
jgi:hypothetical protein